MLVISRMENGGFVLGGYHREVLVQYGEYDFWKEHLTLDHPKNPFLGDISWP